MFIAVLRVALGVVLGLVGLYALLGVFQAAMLFTGARALSNFNLWASVSFLAYCASVALLARPWRLVPRISSGFMAAAAFVLGIASIALVEPVLAEFFAVDACLDSGGSFNYIASRCDHSDNHQFVGLGRRSGFRILFSLACISGGLALAFLAVRRVRANNSFKPTPLRDAAKFRR